jgi:hypothetical protein
MPGLMTENAKASLKWPRTLEITGPILIIKIMSIEPVKEATKLLQITVSDKSETDMNLTEKV